MADNPITKADAWILAQHQKVADWAYTRWDVSPYWIAAQIFGALSLLLLLSISWDFHRSNFYGVGSSVFLLSLTAHDFYRATAKDDAWKTGRQTLPDLVDHVFRPIYVALTALLALGLLLAYVYAKEPALLVAPGFDVGVVGLITLARYFLSCSPPTYRHGRERSLIAQPTGI